MTAIKVYLGRTSVRLFLFRTLVYLLLAAGAVVVLVPFVWMISTSLKLPGTEFAYPPQWIPHPIYWRNFIEGWNALPFSRWFANTLLITALSVVGAISSSTLVGYGFARFTFPFRNILFVILLSTIMLPFHVRLIPTFILFRYLGWINTYLPLVVPLFVGGVPFYIFLMRQFMMSIPFEIDDAATIDGAGILRTFTSVMLPLCRPVIGVVAILEFMRAWNAFLNPLIYLNSTQKFTLAIGLRYFQEQMFVKWTYLMAVSLMVLVPCIALFFIAQKYYIRGVVTTGIKG